jgi:hypothetical protein
MEVLHGDRSLANWAGDDGDASGALGTANAAGAAGATTDEGEAVAVAAQLLFLIRRGQKAGDAAFATGGGGGDGGAAARVSCAGGNVFRRRGRLRRGEGLLLVGVADFGFGGGRNGFRKRGRLRRRRSLGVFNHTLYHQRWRNNRCSLVRGCRAGSLVFVVGGVVLPFGLKGGRDGHAGTAHRRGGHAGNRSAVVDVSVERWLVLVLLVVAFDFVAVSVFDEIVLSRRRQGRSRN